MPNNKKHKREKNKSTHDKTRDLPTDTKGPITLTKNKKREAQLILILEKSGDISYRNAIEHQKRICNTVFKRWQELIAPYR